MLLKNDDGLLPLSPGQRVSVIGELARTPRHQGAGSSRVNPTKVVSALDAAERRLPGHTFAAGYRTDGEPDAALVAEASQRIVVALSNGAGVTTASWRGRVPAIVEFWLTGQAGGDSTPDVLLGEVTPSGKLAETVPVRLEDTPAFLVFAGEHGHVRYGEGIHVGYRHYDTRKLAVDFLFGHGLSYIEFRYDTLEVAVHDLTDRSR